MFPIEQSAANTTQTSNATSWGAQNMPSGIVAGDTLLALVAVDGPNQAVTFTGGWTKLLDGAAGSDGSVTLAVAYKKAVGSDTLSLTIGSGQQGSCRVIRVDTAEDPDTQAPEIGAVTTGASQFPNVGLITPIGGAKDYKFYAVCAHDRNRAFTSAPTDYQANDASLISGGSNGSHLAWGDRDVNASTQDPDNFSFASSDGFANVVVVVHPGATGNRVVTCITEALQLSENAAAVNASRIVTAPTEILELNENAAALNRQRGVNAVTEALLLSTVQASVSASRGVLGLVEPLLLATNNASVNLTRLVTALTEVLELAENIATVVKAAAYSHYHVIKQVRRAWKQMRLTL